MGSPSLAFGDFEWICRQASLTICPALGLGDPTCYSRNIGVNSFLVFQPAVLLVDIGALIMTTIMVLHVKRKYTAVGRKEMAIFLYTFMLCIIMELLLITGIIPMSLPVYKSFAATHVASITVACVLLLMNGFVSFQWAEDGTNFSIWMFRITALLFGGISYFIAIGTFFGISGLNPKKPIILYTMIYIFNGSCILLYVISQIILVANTIRDMWPIGTILLGLIFLGLSFTSTLVLNTAICQFALHYIDGMFLGSMFIILSVMMIYKYWDTITNEDLEFAVTGCQQVWHMKNTMDLPISNNSQATTNDYRKLG